MTTTLPTLPRYRGFPWFFGTVTIGASFFIAPFDMKWTSRVLILAAIVVVPLALRIVALEKTDARVDRLARTARIAQFVAGWVLAYALLQPQGMQAAVLAAVYAIATLLVAAWGVLQAWQHRRGPLASLCIDAGLIYLSVGGLASFFDRAGLQPLGFDPAIVQLTAVHFHFAGFVLLLLTGLAAKPNDRLSQVNCIAVVIAVPLVGIGITTSRLGASPLIECVAAWFMAIGGLMTALQYFRLVGESRWPIALRACWLVVGASLVFSMWLAALYGSRFYTPVPWLDIPPMRAMHGTANCVGVGLIGMVGWTMAARNFATYRERTVNRVRGRSASTS
jgi:hypothetical protein